MYLLYASDGSLVCVQGVNNPTKKEKNSGAEL